MSIHKIAYISHGGGPLPLLNDPEHKEMRETLEFLASKIGHPKAIVLISAHWEQKLPTITSGEHPSLIYDYSGFPKAAYEIEYPCQGMPQLAHSVKAALTKAGIPSKLDESRGLDHGVYVPLKIMYPEANVPVVQLSLVNSLDAVQHLEIGKALRNIQWDDLLIIGSGFSFHNMSAFFARNSDAMENRNLAFEEWLRLTISNRELSEMERFNKLSEWQSAPYARFCHPREEHLLPLHVCYGLAGEPSLEVVECKIMGKHTSMFYWD